MDGHEAVLDANAAAETFVLKAQVSCREPDGLSSLARAFAHDDLSLVVLFVSADADFAATMGAATAMFGAARVIGCTTAGEIGRDGYCEGEIVALGFRAAHFAADPVLMTGIDRIDRQRLTAHMIRRRADLATQRPDWPNEFGLLLVDGLSLMEDPTAAACASALGPVPLFGGSAGDGTRFGHTAVAIDGTVHTNAAILTYFRSDCRARVFSINHLQPTEQRMVVTSADPSRRIVRELNAEPAAREYARILGKDPEQLDPFTFAAHPVTVRFGGQHHVRAIQQVSPLGELVFFSAIDEGLVLSLAEPEHMSRHLNRELENLATQAQPDTIIACDCILRRLEAQEKQLSREVSGVLSRHGVIGFSTYGEQVGGIHVNQTMTGVAIYPPGSQPE